MTRVGVFGASGRMGRTVCAAVVADPDLELVAAIDPAFDGNRTVLGEGMDSVRCASSADALLEVGAEVVIDFTVASAARSNLAFAAEQGLHAVVGTTGLADDDLAKIAGSFTRSSCLVAANFAIGAVLMMRFAELAAPWFETAEIIELHHDAKVDAPSGTALRTAERMAAVSGDWADDPTTDHVLDGARGGAAAGGIPVHAVRLRGLFAHQEVLLGTVGQSLTIRHDTYDRTCYMPGVLLAVKHVHERPGLTIGLEPLLDL
ncbi:MAG: 4-hydroxy-tetrahydrodipicolinate reductase [Acidimicrobiales bacterium]